MIYDEESDRHVHITFEAALKASCYGVPNGPNTLPDNTPSDLFGIMGFERASRINDLYMKSRDKAIERGSAAAEDLPPTLAGPKSPDEKDDAGTPTENSVDKSVKQEYTTKASAEEKADYAAGWALACVKAGVWCPVEIVIARPFIEHLMLSAIVTVAGRDTGATLFGPADMLVHTSPPRQPRS